MSKLEIKDDGKDFVVVSGFPNQPTKLYLGRETGYEIFRRWNCHDDLVAACEATERLLVEVAEMNIAPFPYSAVDLNKKVKAALAKAKE